MPLAKPSMSPLRILAGHFPYLARFYRGIRDQLDSMELPVVTPWGFKLVGNRLMSGGLFEPSETELVRKLLKDVDILVNVGANIGYYCCHALSMGKQVIAFEPMQRNLRYLYQNIKINNWTGAEIYPIVLSNSIGVSEIYGQDTGASIIKGWAGIPESYVTLVPTSTMDVVLGRRLQGKKVLFVVDVEGAEKLVLEGAENILSNDPKPIWIVEITAEEHQPKAVSINPNLKNTFQLFFKNSYQALNIGEGMHLVTAEDIDLVSKGELKFSMHNFLFTKTEAI
jgi:FkbM family methyltransferase